MSTTPKAALYKRPPAVPGSEPFEGDVLDRAPLAKKLTGLIERLTEGAVIGINGEWGEGKSWFGRNWRLDLEKQGFRTFYLDAFEHDFSDDAFVVIAAEILKGLGPDTSAQQKFLESAKRVAVSLLPITAKAIVSAGIKVVTGITAEDLARDVGDKIADAGATAAEKLVEKRVKDHESNQHELEHFRDLLKDFCSKQEKPVVFFVDELDRCKPQFAVQVIERIKHLFDVDKLIFVLLLNRRQLEASINGVYGQSVAASDYLSKFVQFFVTLPARSTARSIENFCWEIARRYGYPETRAMTEFVSAVVGFAMLLDLTLRDIERVFILFGLTERVESSAFVAAYLAILKLKKPEIFAGLKSGKKGAHGAAIEFLGALHQTAPDFWALRPLLAIHRLNWVDGDLSKVNESDREALSDLSSGGVRSSRVIPWLTNALDLPNPE